MKAYCLLNHQLTDNQLFELNHQYNVNSIEYPNKELSDAWSQIKPNKDLDMSLIGDIKEWLKSAQNNDILIIQGEFGTTFMVVDYALKHNLVPLHAVTKRVAKEERNGESVKREYIFQHVCFRKYQYFEGNV